jgi:hypothetical protein
LVSRTKKLGFFYIPEGRVLVYKISQYVNKRRYSTNLDLVVCPSLIEIKRVLDIKLPVILQPNMLHVDLAKAFTYVFKQRSI